jgi:hypothetical protein
VKRLLYLFAHIPDFIIGTSVKELPLQRFLEVYGSEGKQALTDGAQLLYLTGYSLSTRNYVEEANRRRVALLTKIQGTIARDTYYEKLYATGLEYIIEGFAQPIEPEPLMVEMRNILKYLDKGTTSRLFIGSETQTPIHELDEEINSDSDEEPDDC